MQVFLAHLEHKATVDQLEQLVIRDHLDSLDLLA